MMCGWDCCRAKIPAVEVASKAGGAVWETAMLLRATLLPAHPGCMG